MCALSALMICSCEREYPVEPEKKSPEYSWSIIPQKIKREFLYRFPEAKVTRLIAIMVSIRELPLLTMTAS
jgi:hypothetical protein